MALDSDRFEGYLAKSKANLAEAEACLSQKLISAAINRAYNALHQAANARIELKGYRSSPRSHSVEGWAHWEVAAVWVRLLEDLGVLEVTADDHEIYDQVYRLRVMADYNARVEPAIRHSERAVADAKKALGYLYRAFERQR